MDHADPFLPEGVLLLFQDYLTYIDTNQIGRASCRERVSNCV